MSKEQYRDSIVGMNAVQITDMYDHELNDAVMHRVQQSCCESSRGSILLEETTLDFNESFTFSDTLEKQDL